MIKKTAAAAALGTMFGLFGGGGASQAHLVDNKGKWLVTGSTYGKEKLSKRERKDPISVIWSGVSGTAETPTITAAMEHTQAHWTEKRIRSKYPRGKEMKWRSGKNPFCTGAQHVFMRDGGGVNSGAWSASRGYMSTDGACRSQYHIRLWNDNKHVSMYGASHQYTWVLAPIHHDRLFFDCCTPPRPNHRSDVPWDSVRAIYEKTMRPEHCTKLHWRVNPESQGFKYGPYKYSGVVTRISFRHRSQGCSGA